MRFDGLFGFFVNGRVKLDSEVEFDWKRLSDFGNGLFGFFC